MVNTFRLDWNGRGIDHVNLNCAAKLILQCFHTLCNACRFLQHCQPQLNPKAAKSIHRALCEAVEKSWKSGLQSKQHFELRSVGGRRAS